MPLGILDHMSKNLTYTLSWGPHTHLNIVFISYPLNERLFKNVASRLVAETWESVLWLLVRHSLAACVQWASLQHV